MMITENIFWSDWLLPSNMPFCVHITIILKPLIINPCLPSSFHHQIINGKSTHFYRIKIIYTHTHLSISSHCKIKISFKFLSIQLTALMKLTDRETNCFITMSIQLVGHMQMNVMMWFLMILDIVIYLYTIFYIIRVFPALYHHHSMYSPSFFYNWTSA